MIRQLKFSFNQRPAWQRFLMIGATLVLTATLFWIGLIVIFSLALVALAVAMVNRIKIKLTGRPLFTAPKHFHRYQSQFNQNRDIEGEVIEGEVIDKTDNQP